MRKEVQSTEIRHAHHLGFQMIYLQLQEVQMEQDLKPSKTNTATPHTG